MKLVCGPAEAAEACCGFECSERIERREAALHQVSFLDKL
jgi:hypothetical protein